MEEKWYTVKGYRILTYGSYIEYATDAHGNKLFPCRRNAWGDWSRDRFCTLDAFRHGFRGGYIRLEEDISNG